MSIDNLLILYLGVLTITFVVVGWFVTKELLVAQHQKSEIWQKVFEELHIDDSRWNFLLTSTETEAEGILEVLRAFEDILTPIEKKIFVLQRKYKSFAEIADLMGLSMREVQKNWSTIRRVIYSRVDVSS